MAGHRVTRHPADDVAAYLEAIAARLPGPRRARASALAELRDGLHDAIDTRTAAGMTTAEAIRTALHESGPPAVVAAAYAEELAAVAARRAAQALLVTGPVIGLLWLASLAPGAGPDVLLRSLPPLAGIVAVATAAGALTIAATGHGMRWLPDIPRLPQYAAACACAAAVCGDLAVLVLAATRALTSPAALPSIVIVAVAGSITRLVCAQHAARRQLRAGALGGVQVGDAGA